MRPTLINFGVAGHCSDFGPVVNESNSSQGPANFTAFANTKISGSSIPVSLAPLDYMVLSPRRNPRLARA